MSFLTVDQLIAKLQRLKESGVPGEMPVAISAVNSQGQAGFFQRIEGAGRVAVAKSDLDKGSTLCKAVATQGVDVVVIR
ncbi:MAG: hypothetical protein ACJAUZ_002393 [Flavobacteriaceae bacterium]|jgi:hypothetical protein